MCDHCGCREFAPIAELTAEHEEILGRAWTLSELLREGAPLPQADVDRLAEILALHAVKEETGLYPELIELGGLSAEQLADLEREHVELHAQLLAHRFDRRAYFELAAHIEVEETELFSAARFGFDEPEWDAMESAHRRAEAARAAELTG